MEKLYVAYGSNLNIEQMKQRCPTAKVICTSEMEDYELNFKGSTWNAHATVDKKIGDSVPVTIWKISKEDEKSLDMYEGFPNYYRKENIEIDVLGLKQEAMVYIMNNQNFGIPSNFYVKIIENGYKDAGFDTEFLHQRVEKSIQEVKENWGLFVEKALDGEFDDETDYEELDSDEPDYEELDDGELDNDQINMDF